MVGMSHYYGMSPLRLNAYVKCVKEPDNMIDSEAIKVVLPNLGTVGHVANSTYTALRGYSAGQIGEIIKKESFYAKICFIANKLCAVR